jgi:hypothetical protein
MRLTMKQAQRIGQIARRVGVALDIEPVENIKSTYLIAVQAETAMHGEFADDLLIMIDDFAAMSGSLELPNDVVDDVVGES